MNQPPIEIKKVAELKGAPYNPRTISKEAMAGLRKSIERFGLVEPIIWNKQTGHVVGGHQRLKVLQAMGTEETPVVIVDLPETEEKALNVALNNPLITGEFTDDLKPILGELATELPELYEELRLADLGEELGMLEEPEAEEDDFEEPKVAKYKIERGEVWQLGRHRLMCGDSTKEEDVARLMGDSHGQITFTSPPYNAGALEVEGNKGTQPKYRGEKDTRSHADYVAFLSIVMDIALKSTDELLLNIGLVETNKRAIVEILNDYSDEFKDIIYWVKATCAPHITEGIINNRVEFILAFGDGKRKFRHAQFSQGSYWNVIEGKNASGNEYADIHKATFPTYLPSNIITNFTDDGAVVLDPFGGSGTTLIACEQLNRTCHMMEIDPFYCSVIIERWEKLTGKSATRLGA